MSVLNLIPIGYFFLPDYSSYRYEIHKPFVKPGKRNLTEKMWYFVRNL